jgi:hypothetical protein
MPKTDAMLQYIYDAFRNTWDKLANILKVSEQFPDSYDQAQDAKKIENVQYTIRSLKATNFVAALTTGNSANATLTGLASNKIRIKRVKAICLLATAARAFDFWFFQTSGFQTTDQDTDSFEALVQFLATAGLQANTGTYANEYYYDSGALDIPYECLDGTFALDAALVWRDATAKAASPTEYVVLVVDYEPCA